ncbi:MAG: RNA methyltransferase [Candidatus Uhrbacteria bacterium]|nr:RNA methyltransferase [Candidatus Uhrbacteria bacterium]
MLTNAQIKLVKSLATKKGRLESGFCLVEGAKVIETAGDAVDFTFTREDSFEYEKLVTTETPQEIAGVARIPKFEIDDIKSSKTIVVLDGVQDPGNVGAILRLCLGFNASLLLIESADTTSPKVVRSSSGAIFLVPWMNVARDKAESTIKNLKRDIFRLEITDSALTLDAIETNEPAVIIAGSEGSGIKLEIEAPSVKISHSTKIESLNVANALAIALHARN